MGDHSGFSHSRQCAHVAVQLGLGYFPAGGLGVILVVAPILLLFRASTV